MSTPRTPILWSVRPTSTPSQARSTMNAVTESWARLVGSLVLAKTVYQSASRTPDIQHLVPLSTQPPVGGARVGHGPGPHAHDVAAGLGLGQPEGGPQRAVADAGQVALLLLLGAGDHDRPGGQPGEQEHQRRGVGVLGHLLDGEREAEDPRPRAAVLGRDAQPEQAGVAERVEDVGRVGALLVDGPGPGLHLVLGEAPHRSLQLGQFVGKVEMHRRRLSDAPARYFLVLDPRCTRAPRECRDSTRDHG